MSQIDVPNQTLVNDLLEPYGFKDYDTFLRHIRQLSHEPFFIFSVGRTERNLNFLLPHLIPAIARTPDPDKKVYKASVELLKRLVVARPFIISSTNTPTSSDALST